MTRFKELCLDTAAGGRAVGAFWAAAAGLRYDAPADPVDPGDLFGDEEGMGIALCPVEEGKQVKNRVHLDVHCSSVEDLVTLGATVLDGYGDLPWTVLSDPEGNELCAFERTGPLPAYRVFELGVDAVDPEQITRWWATVFDIAAQHEEGKPWWHLEGVPGLAMPYWVFAPVPEAKQVKNRLHWDVYGDPADFLERGATHLWNRPGWTVLADPEGNEFCVFAPPD